MRRLHSSFEVIGIDVDCFPLVRVRHLFSLHQQELLLCARKAVQSFEPRSDNCGPKKYQEVVLCARGTSHDAAGVESPSLFSV